MARERKSHKSLTGRDELERGAAAVVSRLRDTALSNCNAFIELVLLDERGERKVQSALHQEIQSFIDYCQTHGIETCGIAAPMGSGKSTQVADRVLYWLTQDPALRIKWVSNNTTNASKRSSYIRDHLVQNAVYRRLFPEIRLRGQEPRSTQAGVDAFTLERNAFTSEPSLETWQVLSGATGGRADYLVFDDIVDHDNAIAKPALREKVVKAFNTMWISRLDENPARPGFICYIATPWHKDDLTMQLMANPHWAWLIARVSDDFEYLACERVIPDGKGGVTRTTFKLPHWSRYDKKRLIKEFQRTPRKVDFDLRFRLRPWQEEECLFQEVLDKLIERHRDVTFADIARMPGTTFSGVDISGPKRRGSSVCSIKILTNGQKALADVRSGRWTSPVLADQIQEVYNEFKPTRIGLENNSIQGAVMEWMEVNNFSSIDVLEGLFTSSNKVNPETGVASLLVEMDRGQWLIPGAELKGHSPACKCSACAWLRDMMDYPNGDYDNLMSTWIAREIARKTMQGGDASPRLHVLAGGVEEALAGTEEERREAREQTMRRAFAARLLADEDEDE